MNRFQRNKWQHSTVVRITKDNSSHDSSLHNRDIVNSHFITDKAVGDSYIKLLLFELLILKPYAANYDVGYEFVEDILKSMNSQSHLNVMLTQVLQCEENAIGQWIQDVEQFGGNTSFAVDALMINTKMQTGDKGLESVCSLFTLMKIKEELLLEATEATRLISNKKWKTLLQKSGDWNVLKLENIKAYLLESVLNDGMTQYAIQNLFMKNKLVEAFSCLKNLADLGNGRAMYLIGEYYRFGWGNVSVNKELGFQYHHKGAIKGEVLCQLNCAYEDGADRDKICEETIPKVRKLAEAGDIIAEDELGDVLSSINSGDESLLWLRKSASEGYWRAAMNLAEKVEKEEKISLYEYISDLDGDHAGEAFNRLGNIYWGNNEYGKANEFYEKAGQAGEPWGLMNLADSYKNGTGIEKDEAKAFKLYSKALHEYNLASADSANWCGIYCHNKGDYQQEVEWFQKGAECGSDWSMNNLGNCYKNGWGVTRAPGEATRWYEKAFRKNGPAKGAAAKSMADIIYDNGTNEDFTILGDAWKYYKEAELLGVKGASEGVDNVKKKFIQMINSGKFFVDLKPIFNSSVYSWNWDHPDHKCAELTDADIAAGVSIGSLFKKLFS